MISIELLRFYPFFSGLSLEQLGILAKAANEIIVQPDQYLFHEGETTDHFYVVKEGVVEIVFEVPAPDTTHKLSDQFSRKLQTKNVIVSAIGPGEIFGWSGLLPPHKATASAIAMSVTKVIAIDCRELRKIFEEDCRFGYLMTQKAANVIRERLHDMRKERLVRQAARAGSHGLR